MDASDTRSRTVAVGLMRMALTFLDETDDDMVVARLQHAIDTALATGGREDIDPRSAALIAAMPLDS
ncbi:MAG: hypothetical protein JHD35_19975 [Sphingopyxis sp.]|nr:hypothetical protein [Sphingopyxis sp.]